MGMTELFTVREVAELLKTSCTVVRKLIQSGDLTTLFVGREYRIPLESIQAFIESNLC